MIGLAFFTIRRADFNLDSFPPRVYIVGAQKCGTTSLAKALGSNPDVCLSEPKEPNFFSVNFDKGLEWYKECFSDLEKVLVDASTTYTMCALSERALAYKAGRQKQIGVPARIKSARPDACLIYIIRDPVKRLYSNYWHNRKYGYEDAPLMEAVERDPQYKHLSEYYGQLSLYLQHFQRSQILVLKFEDFVRDQQHYINVCERFMGITETLQTQARDENKSREYSPIGQRLMSMGFTKRIGHLVPKKLKQVIRDRLSREIPPLDESDELRLRSFFEEDQAMLQEHFGIRY